MGEVWALDCKSSLDLGDQESYRGVTLAGVLKGEEWRVALVLFYWLYVIYKGGCHQFCVKW